MVLRECPFCHRPLEARLLSKEEIDSSEATKVGDFPLEVTPFRGTTRGGLSALGRNEPDRNTIALHPEAFITYRMTYRCNHCGKEWTKISVEAKSLPRDYAIDEGEKTDADAEVETEDAREEEYVSEER